MITEQDKQNMPLIKIDHLTYEPVKGLKVIDDITINFHLGENTVVTGSPGSGKSSLLALICGIYSTFLGNIYFNKEKISYKSREDIAYTSSALSLKDRRTPKEYKKLLGTFFGNFSESTFDMLTEKFHIDEDEPVSSMDPQKLDLLRMTIAFSRKCMLYALDEPLNSFPPEERIELLKYFFDIAEDSTIIAVTELNELTEPLFSRLLCLKNGRIQTYDSIEFLKLKNSGFKQGFSEDSERGGENE